MLTGDPRLVRAGSSGRERGRGLHQGSGPGSAHKRRCPHPISRLHPAPESGDSANRDKGKKEKAKKQPKIPTPSPTPSSLSLSLTHSELKWELTVILVEWGMTQ